MQTGQMIFYYEDPIEFLNSHFREKQKRNPKFSLRAWARQMGYQNPSLLFQVLKGERRLKMDLALKLAANLQLKGKALRYFELIVLARTCQTETERRVFESMLAKLRPRKFPPLNNLSLDMFAAAADWYHWVILGMTELKDFNPDPAWIQERVEGDLDKRTIKTAWDRLLRLGLLVQLPDGRFSMASEEDNILFMQNEVPSEAIRQFHLQMIEKAKAAVTQQTVDERILRSSTISVKKEDLSKISEIIGEAHQKILELSVKHEGDEIYQLNSQFFRVTKKKVERAH
jgi:uncharacterized protein (TIGR02147 family)